MKILFLIISISITFSSITQSNINISQGNFFDGEPYLVIDPSNNQHLIVSWMGVKIGEAVVIKTSHSFDGGITWTTPTNLNHEQSGNTSADVSMAYNFLGDLFICYIDYDNTNFTFGQVIVRKSTDNGVTWGNSVVAIDFNSCPNQLCIDRPWMVIDNNNRIFITSMNANQPTLVNSPYHPYFVVSSDNGASFSQPAFLDGPGYLAGSLIKQPVPSPTIGADGTFYSIYPSYVFTQNVSTQMILAKSTDGGTTFNYSIAHVGNDGVSDPYAKKGFTLTADPTDANHLSLVALYDTNADADVYHKETLDGINWSTITRVNQDPVSNGKMQDLVWSDYNTSGDLAVCWRDRRNASATGYQTETEIYCSVKYKDSINFSSDFAISQQVAHDAVLEGAGNDFMNLQFRGDTIYTVWGDVRTGTLNIFINKTNVNTGISNLYEIHKEKSFVNIYPNPSINEITIGNFDKIKNAEIYNLKGEFVQKIESNKIDTHQLAKGEYLIIYSYQGKRFSTKFIKK